MLSPSGEPCGMFGVGADGYVWALATPEMERHPMTFLRHSAQWVRAKLAQYGRLHTWADTRNAIHIKWLRWLGFRPTGLEKPPTIHLILETSHHV